jgi:hypothetical protein
MELLILILVLGGFITLYILTMKLNEKVAVPESCKAAYLEAQSCESCGSKSDKETKGSCGFSNTLEFLKEVKL